MNVFIRADSSVEIGTGHVMRCLTLAKRLRKSGNKVTFICREAVGDCISFIQEQGFTVLKMPAVEGSLWNYTKEHWLIDADQTLKFIRNKNVGQLIIDHYSIDEKWEGKIKPFVKKLMVIDDLADRKHACDILLDQNFYISSDKSYQGLIPSDCKIIIGPKYALLRDEFKLSEVNIREEVNRIFVFLGGSDPTNETTKVINAFLKLKRKDLDLDVVVGQSNPFKESIKDLCSKYPNLNYYTNVNNIAEIMLKADLAIGAGGSTTWERCALALPSIVLIIANNQEKIAKNIEIYGSGVCLGKSNNVSEKTIVEALKDIIDNKEKIKEMSRKSKELVDGKGVDRVVKVMNSNKKITILSDRASWINKYIANWRSQVSFEMKWIHDHEDISSGDFLFILSYSKIIPKGVLEKNTHNLVVHESDLPSGRGWSPLTWQIIEGENEIPIVLFEAMEEVDTGPIYLKSKLYFDGSELITELREKQGKKTIELCTEFLNNYPDIINNKVTPIGSGTYYPKRTPKDSKLDIDKSLKEQFNLLRTVDNQKYPAYFEVNDKRYRLFIENYDE